jgi:hypothetical protein
MYCFLFLSRAYSLKSATVDGKMTVDPTPRLIDVRQIGPNSERDISGRCSACGVVLIARLDNWEDAKPELLRDKLEKLFARHLIDTACGKSQNDPTAK